MALAATVTAADDADPSVISVPAFNATGSPHPAPLTPIEAHLVEYFAALQRVADVMQLGSASRRDDDAGCTYAIAVLGVNRTMSKLPQLPIVTDAAGKVVPTTDAVFDALIPIIAAGMRYTFTSKGSYAAGTFAFVCAKTLPSIAADATNVTAADFIHPLVFGDASHVTADLTAPFEASYADGAANETVLETALGFQQITSWTLKLQNGTKAGGDDDSGLSTGAKVAIGLGVVCGVLVIVGYVAMRRKMREDAQYHELTGGPPKMESGSPVLEYYRQKQAYGAGGRGGGAQPSAFDKV